MAERPGRGIEGEEQGGGVHAPGDRHRPDRTGRTADGRAGPGAGGAGEDRRRRPGRAAPRRGVGVGTGAAPDCRTVRRPAAASTGRRSRERTRPARPKTRLPAAVRPPSAWALSRAPSSVTSTVPSRSVRNTRGPCAWSRAMVAGAGCPYGLLRARRHGRDPRPDRVEERARRRRATAVVGDLEEVDPRQSASQEDRVDPLLDVAGQEEPLAAEGPEQDDRDVVDAGPRVGRFGWDRAAIRPQDLERHVVERERVAGREAPRLGGPPRRARRPGRDSRGPARACPGSTTRATRYRSSSRAMPATWSSCGWVRTRRSIRRSHGGTWASSATRRRSGSGPPSMSIRAPRSPSTRIASPCPTSRTVIRTGRRAGSRRPRRPRRRDREGGGHEADRP